MNNIKIWLDAFRLRTLPLSVSGIILGSCLAYFKGHFSLSIFILALLTTIALQILSNLANDYGDGVKGTDNQDRIGPQRAIQSGAILPSQMLKAIKINVLIVVVLAFTLIYRAFGWEHLLYAGVFFVLAGLSIYAALKYTMGKSAYGYRGLGDIFVFLFFGLLSVMGTYFLYLKHLDYILILPAVALGLLSTGVLNLNNMRDIASDARAGKNTLACKLGAQRAKRYHLCLMIGAMLCIALFATLYYHSIFNLLGLLSFIPLLKHVRVVYNNKIPQNLDPELKKLALATFLLSVLVGIGYIL